MWVLTFHQQAFLILSSCACICMQALVCLDVTQQLKPYAINKCRLKNTRAREFCFTLFNKIASRVPYSVPRQFLKITSFCLGNLIVGNAKIMQRRVLAIAARILSLDRTLIGLTLWSCTGLVCGSHLVKETWKIKSKLSVWLNTSMVRKANT